MEEMHPPPDDTTTRNIYTCRHTASYVTYGIKSVCLHLFLHAACRLGRSSKLSGANLRFQTQHWKIYHIE